MRVGGVPASIPFDPIADRYDESRGGERRGTFMAGVLAPHLDPGGVTVELGIGTGIVAAAMSAQGYGVVGVDLSPPMLGRAAARVPGRVAVADATSAPLQTGFASGAYVVWVLHVVDDPAAVVREAVRVVRPGGSVAIVPANVGAGVPGDAIDEAHAPLDSLRPWRPGVHEVQGWLTAAGVGAVEVHTTHDESAQSPNAAAEAVEQRNWSSLWDVDDATWEALVVPVIAALRALPDPDTPRVRRHPVDVVVGRVG